MKNYFKPVLLLPFVIGISFSNIYAQDDPEPDTITINEATEDSLIFQSISTISVEAVSTVRLSSSGSTFIKWTNEPDYTTGYSVRYKLADATSWTTVSNGSKEIVLTNLSLDTIYHFEIIPTGFFNLSAYKYDVGIISTRAQTEPIAVSHTLFNQLMGWFTDDSPTKTFCKFLGDISVHHFEKLAFLQVYAFNNESFEDGGSSSSLSDWFPSRFTGLSEDICLPDIWGSSCKCVVISDGSNIATPGRPSFVPFIAHIKPKIVQKIAKAPGDKTYIDRFEAGAAKYIALRQDEGAGGMNYQMSNIEGGGEETAVTSEASEIQFFLGCLNRSDETPGTGTTNLPESCKCERPLNVSYEYTTNLYVQANKKSCLIGSRGAAAQAEDMAIVVAYNGKTGELTPLDAGKFMVGRRCSSDWNPQWWINLLNVAGSVFEYYVATLDDGSNNIPTSSQISGFISAVTTLIGTPFSNNSGECGTIEAQQVLVSNSKQLTLLPNQPIRISLFSSYYVRTRGYGCYRSEAAIASDYFLLGVVESENTDDPECCADKFATYIVGSLSVPENGDVDLEAVNDIPTRLNEVAFNLDPYGSWYGYGENPHTGLITLIHHFTRLYGPSCSIVTPFQSPSISKQTLSDGHIIGFPSVLDDMVNVELDIQEGTYGQISLIDMAGRMISLFSNELNSGYHKFSFPIHHLSAGNYIINCKIGNNYYNYPFVHLK